MKELLKKPYTILVDLFETNEDEIEAIESLRKTFCSEMASVIRSFKNHESFLFYGLNDLYLADVEEGNYSKAFQVFKYLEEAKI